MITPRKLVEFTKIIISELLTINKNWKILKVNLFENAIFVFVTLNDRYFTFAFVTFGDK